MTYYFDPMSESHDHTPLSTSPCTMCPRLCGALRSEGERGVCGASDTIYVARAALHYWEEPPLSGERGSGAVFFSNCPLRCVYCQNRQIAVREVGLPVSVERLAEICVELQDQGALNVNFVTPTHHTMAIVEAVALARRAGLVIPTVWNTSGYERTEIVRELGRTVDVYLADFKYSDAGTAKRYSNAPDYPDVALAALEAMVSSTGVPQFDEVDGLPRITSGVIVRHLLLPGQLEQSKRALRLLFGRFGNDVLYSIMNQYTPVLEGRDLENFGELGERVPEEDYDQLLDFADDLGIENYFWQEGPAAEESFIPEWDGTGV